ncbi:response regulator [Halobacteriales archaeon QS_8_69_26]|nr:MAG: response regulator [Halobacteriales archaeon QS_8_69_26]
MVTTPDDPEVLIVDDEQQLADLYGAQLPAEYEVNVVYNGDEALEAIDENTDVVLLDRRMPEMSGDDVLDRIRENGYECRVVMISAVDPDFDIGEMPFNDYLCKPVSSRDLEQVIEQQLELRERDRRLNEYLELQSKIMLLEVEKRATELDDSEEYHELKRRAREIEAQIADEVDDFEEIRRKFEKTDRAA